jgi:hypothetical protein
VTEAEHHPLQVDLAIKVADVRMAEGRLAALKARLQDARSREHDLGERAAAARAALREAAGASAAGELDDPKTVNRAKKAVKELDAEYETAEIERQGVSDRVEAAERDVAKKRRLMCLIGTDIAQVAATEIEDKIRDTFTRFARLMHRRHRLASLAAALSTEAAGRYSEPIHYSSETAGLLRQGDDEGLLGILHEQHLTPSFGPGGGLTPLDFESLLELRLSRALEAAAE